MGECFFWLTRVVPDTIQRTVKRLCVHVCVSFLSFSHEIGEEEQLGNDLFCVKWDVKP